MTVYMVERNLPGITIDALAQAQGRAIEIAGRMTGEGTPVRYLRSSFVPEDGCCRCLFEAESTEAVERLNRSAEIPFDRVVEAMDLSP